MGLFTLFAGRVARRRRRSFVKRLLPPPLAPRRLESRRVLDAAAMELLLGPLGAAGETVQVGENLSQDLLSGDTAQASHSEDAGHAGPANVQLFLDVNSLFENDILQLGVTFDDPDLKATHTAVIDWGDGTTPEIFSLAPGSRFLATSHQYLDDNPTATPVDINTIQVTLTDQVANTASATAPITVQNLAPKIDTLLVTPALNENGIAQLQLEFSDPGTLDTHTVEINWGDGTFVETFSLAPGTQFLATSHQYLDDNPTGTPVDTNTVQVRVIDDDGGTATATREVVVSNLAPSIDTLSLTSPIFEDGSTTLVGTYSDPGMQDTHELDIDWDGDFIFDQTVAVTGGSFSISRQFLDDNPTATPSDTFDVNVRLRDDDTGLDAAAVSLTVNNVAPSNIQIQPLAAIDENGIAQLQLTFDDPGTLDTFSVDVDWGDGTPVETLLLGAGARFLATSHQYLDDNPTVTPADIYQVRVTITDDDGGQTTAEAPITVNNVAPILTVAADQALDEAALLDLTGGGLGSFTDVGTLDTHSATVNWGDGTAAQAVMVNQLNGSGTLDGSHIYADNGVYTVTVTLSDDDGGVNVKTFLVTVNNVAPDLTVVGDQTIDEGAVLQIADLGTFTDPGFDNPLNTLDPGNGGQTEERFFSKIDWGDGTLTNQVPAPIDQPGSPGIATSGSFDGSHIYADNGVYTVMVMLTDDDGGVDVETFLVTVNNVDPTLAGIDPAPTINEGEAFFLSDLGVTLEDPGFDNPFNPLEAGGSQETFTALTVDWGDGTPADALSVVNRISGTPGVLTTAEFEHAPHTYADNGLYTVTVVVADDDGGFVTRTFQIEVQNVAPTLVLTDRTLEINEGDTLDLFDLGTFSDPGFDNPLNVADPSNGGELVETFSYTINWGDGTLETGQLPATTVSGSVGVATLGSLVDGHQYLDNDNDNLYTITVTLSDDDGGSTTESIVVTVLNVNPALEPIFATDLNIKGKTNLTIEFDDPGTEVLTVWVDWGDQLALPPDQRFVTETFVLGPGTQNLMLMHTYDGPPNPLSPASDIIISVFIRDDDFGMPLVVDLGQSETRVIAISNPGEGVNPVRIDTTPQVPRLLFPNNEEGAQFFDLASESGGSTQSADLQTAVGDTKSTTDRYLELRVVDSSSGEQSEGYRLKSEVLNDLPGLFRTLPDNRYAIYLVRTETNTRRLVIEVYVRNGKLIDPGDDSEGTRDRPPTDEAASEPPTEPSTTEAQPEEVLEIEPIQLEPVQTEPTKTSSTTAWPSRDRSTRGELPIALSTVAAGLVATESARSWASQIDKTVATASQQQWRDLRRRIPHNRKK